MTVNVTSTGAYLTGPAVVKGEISVDGYRTASGWFNLDSTVPDLTTSPLICNNREPIVGVFCTRQTGHGGRHAAGDGRHTIAVW